MVALKRADCFVLHLTGQEFLTSESVQGASLPLKSIDNIHSSDSLPLSMLSVGDSISDDILKENLKGPPQLKKTHFFQFLAEIF